MRWTCLFSLAFGLFHSAQADVPVHEDGGTQLMQWTQKVQQYSDKNETADEQRMKMDIDRNELEGSVDETAQKMGKVNALLEYIQKLLEAQGSSLDIKDTGDWESGVKNALKLVQLHSEYNVTNAKVIAEGPPSDSNSSADNSPKEIDYTSMDGKILVEKLITIPPRWMDTSGKENSENSSQASYFPRKQKLLIRVAARLRKKLQQNMRSQRLEFLAYGMAKDFLPEKLIASFNAAKTVSYLLGKAGIADMGSGVIIRPAVSQDAAFAKYANLGSDEKSATLFWSDPIVLDGYHPLFGTALNHTSLRGYREVDMDNVISNGHSKKIEQYNMLQPPEKRIVNSFRGYAARVVPGLIYMIEHGQIKDGAIPDEKQLSMAMKLSKELKMLPSQNMKIKKTAFRFSYPPRIILVQDASPGGGATGVVELPELERVIFEKSMFLAGKRLREINTLKNEIYKGRHYVDELIQAIYQLEQELAQVSQGMDKKSAIPQVTQLRKQVFDSLEHYRWVMSKLEYQYDDLLHREWIILHHILESRNQAIERLMEDASARFRTIQHADQSEQSTQDTEGANNGA